MLVKLLTDAFKGESSSEKGDDSTSMMDMLRALSSVKNTVEAQAGLYSQLLQLEWEEQKRRYTRIMVFFLVLIWDHELRHWFIAAMLVVYALMALIAILRMRSLQASWGRRFAAVRDELKADLDIIQSRL